MYDYDINELETISKQIEKVKGKPSIKTSENHINELRKKIETEFAKMIQ